MHVSIALKVFLTVALYFFAALVFASDLNQATLTSNANVHETGSSLSDGLERKKAKQPKPTLVVQLGLKKDGELVAIKVLGRVASVFRLEDGFLYASSAARNYIPTRAIDYAIEARHDRALTTALQLVNDAYANLRQGGKAKSPRAGGKSIVIDDEDEDEPIVIELVEISARASDYTDWGLAGNPDLSFTSCITNCTKTCVDQVSGTSENVFCTIAAAIGALACLPSGPGSVICGAGAGIACFATTAWVRSECPDECTSICWPRQ